MAKNSNGSIHDSHIKNKITNTSNPAIKNTDTSGKFPSILVSTTTSFSPFLISLATPFGSPFVTIVISYSTYSPFCSTDVTISTSSIPANILLTLSFSSLVNPLYIARTLSIFAASCPSSYFMRSKPFFISESRGRYFVISVFTFTLGTITPHTTANTNISPNSQYLLSTRKPQNMLFFFNSVTYNTPNNVN